jgi:disulfide bond formation protein DsbB
MSATSEPSINSLSMRESSAPARTRRISLRSKPAITVLIIFSAVLVLPAAMMAPWAYLTAFPPPPPKSEAQLLTEKMAELGITLDAESFKRGQALFAANCVACHMPDGGARPGLGKDVVHSAFTARSSDKELITFLKLGRNPGDPLNTTGVGMPPKGGNPALMDKDLADLVSFMRGRQAAEDVDFTKQ